MENHWKDFQVGEAGGSGYFRFSAAVDDANEAKIAARERVVAQLQNIYRGTQSLKLDMPFTQWTLGEQIMYPIEGLRDVLVGILTEIARQPRQDPEFGRGQPQPRFEAWVQVQDRQGRRFYATVRTRD